MRLRVTLFKGEMLTQRLTQAAPLCRAIAFILISGPYVILSYAWRIRATHCARNGHLFLSRYAWRIRATHCARN